MPNKNNQKETEKLLAEADGLIAGWDVLLDETSALLAEQEARNTTWEQENTEFQDRLDTEIVDAVNQVDEAGLKLLEMLDETQNVSE